MRTRFTGVGTALITPFRKDGSVDEAAVKRLARRQIDGAAVNYVSYVSYVVNSGIFLRAFMRFVVSAWLYFPPPISRIAPVAYEASLDSSQRIARAISIGCAPR